MVFNFWVKFSDNIAFAGLALIATLGIIGAITFGCVVPIYYLLYTEHIAGPIIMLSLFWLPVVIGLIKTGYDYWRIK